MAYGRRYLSGLTATTITIGTNSVSGDKIVDGSITRAKLAPDAVDDSRVINKGLVGDDLIDGAVDDRVLAPDSVITIKLKDKSVTREKLADDLQTSARPFVPKIGADEILEGAIGTDQLVDDAVETPKIKDGAVTTPKLAAGAVTNEKIADDAIDNDKIQAGAVTQVELANNSVNEGKIINGSVTFNKIGDSAVTTPKINNRAVTTTKIAFDAVETENIKGLAVIGSKIESASLLKRHFGSKRTRIADWNEEFMNGSLSDRWTTYTDPEGCVYPGGINGLAVRADGGIGNQIELRSNFICNILESQPLFNAQVQHRDLTERVTHIGVRCEDGNFVGFKCIAGVWGGNWLAKCDYAVGATEVDTGIESHFLRLHDLSFEVYGSQHVHFYIDGVLVADILSSIPIEKAIRPEILLTTESGSSKILWVRNLSLLGERPELDE